MVEIKLVDLVVKSLSGKEAFYKLPEKERMTVGRSKDADISIPKNLHVSGGKLPVLEDKNKKDILDRLKKISREHFILYWQGGELKIADNSSRNKTYVDGVELIAGADPVTLKDGAIIGLGPSYRLRVVYETLELAKEE